MRSKRVILATMLTMAVATMAAAQKNRIRTYSKSLEKTIEQELETFRTARERVDEPDAATSQSPDWTARFRTRHPAAVPEPEADETKTPIQPFKSVVNVTDSPDVDGQDAEIRLTMPLVDFMEFAPIAALKAAAIPHKFSVGYIYLREETTDRVGRVAFADAEPIAARYRSDDTKAVEDMNDAIIWH